MQIDTTSTHAPLDSRSSLANPRGLPAAQFQLPDGVSRNWHYVASAPRPWLQTRRVVRAWWHASPAPARELLKPLPQADEWIVYFIYAPDGRLAPHHRFTLARCRDMGCRLLVVCATPSAADVPADLAGYVDGLYWKALAGYDFSAYTIALRAIADTSPGASVLVLNDSVLGPFADLRSFLRVRTWQLAGFTASSLIETHIQSYAFILHDVTRKRLEDLAPVLPAGHAYSRAGDVILCQEVYMAKVAARHMAVGAHWFSDATLVADSTLVCPFDLLADGFPFIKRSLVGKHSGFQDPESVRSTLQALGHPVA